MQPINLVVEEKFKINDLIDLNLNDLNLHVYEKFKVDDFNDLNLDNLFLIIEEQFKIDEVIEAYKEILVDINIKPYIEIDLQFEFTIEELSYMRSLSGDSKDKRRQDIAQYYFSMRYTMREIAKHLDCCPATVNIEINAIRKGMIENVKNDLRTNKKVLGHMIELVEQGNYRIRVIWNKYSESTADQRLYRTLIEEGLSQKRRNSKSKITNLRALIEAGKAVNQAHIIQQGYLNLLRQETKQLLEIWDKFGLCGDEAIKVILSGGIDIDVKIQEVRQSIVKMISIVKTEVKDKNAKNRIFGRMVKEIKVDGFTKFDSETTAGIYR